RGISLNINALSAVIFLFTTLLVVVYYFITQKNKQMGVV
ncbi:ABC transporter permease, partial [Schinkia azotoformans]|nr:ABC transporter permease [Schinkia azotoformans]